MRHLTESDLPDDDLSSRLSDDGVLSELEIGISSGQLFCQMASTYRRRFFVGVEVKPVSSYIAAQNASRKSLTNGVVINMEAQRFMRNWISESVFSVIHIYFPTPFPSALKLPHRLVNHDFIREAFRILKPGGVLRFVTDHEHYYREVCGLFPVKSWWAIDWQALGLHIPNGYFVGTRHEVDLKKKNNGQIYALQVVRMP